MLIRQRELPGSGRNRRDPQWANDLQIIANCSDARGRLVVPFHWNAAERRPRGALSMPLGRTDGTGRLSRRTQLLNPRAFCVLYIQVKPAGELSKEAVSSAR